jgi:putative transcriptional regulator
MKNDLRELRTGQGISQEELARALDVTRQTIISIEKGRYVPSLGLALKIGRFFAKPVEEIFREESQ